MSSPQVPDSIRALFDSCRDDFDLAQPAMQPLRTWLAESEHHSEALKTMRRMDEQIQVALHDVATPVGLKKRLLRLVGSKETILPPSLDGLEIDLPKENQDLATQPAAGNGVAHPSIDGGTDRIPSKRGRPLWLAIGAPLAAIAALVFVAISWGRFQTTVPSSPSARELCESSLAWIQLAENSGPNVQEQASVPKLKLIHTDYGQTECYLTTLDNGIRVFQFRFSVGNLRGLPKQIPTQPDLPPGQGFVCSAYQKDGQVIVTAVEGDANDYRNALATMIAGVP